MTDEKKATAASVYSQRGPTRVPSPPTGQSTPNTWLRVAGALAGVGAAWVGLLGVSWTFNILDWRLGRLAVTVAAGGAVVAALVLVVPDTRALQRVGIAAAGLVAGLLFITFAVSAVAPGYYALRAEFHRIPNPPGWTSRNEQAAGNSICFDECKSIERELVPNTDDPDRAANTMMRLLERHGYRLISSDPDGARVFRKGDFKVTYWYSDGQPVNSVDTLRPPSWYLEIEAWQGY